MKYYGGSQWWVMNISNLKKMNNFINDHKKDLFDFFADSYVPDEFFFHSIIMKLKEIGEDIIIDDSLTYVNWTRTNCPLPVVFNSDDLNELLNQPQVKLFARKFNIDFDQKILHTLSDYVVHS